MGICYHRVSSDGQRQDNTIESQRLDTSNYARRENLDIDATFEDNGLTGRDGNRPGLIAMLTYLAQNYKKGQPRIPVIIQDISRLARNVALYGKITKDIKDFGGELHLVHRRVEDTPEGMLMDNIEASFAQYQSDSNKVRTMVRMVGKMRNGHYLLNPPPGLKRIRDENKNIVLILDEARASLVVQAFEKFASGELQTKKSVAEFLRSHTEWHNKTFTETSAKLLLENKVYTGIFAYEKDGWNIDCQEWKMDRVVPQELFERVQKRLGNIGRTPRKTDTKQTFTLGNEILCEECGTPLTGYFCKGRNGVVHEYYRCYGKKCSLNNTSFRRADVEAAFVEKLDTLGADDKVLNVFSIILERVNKQRAKSNTERRNRLKLQIRDTEQQIESFGALIAKSVQSNNQAMLSIYESQIQAATNRKNELEKEFESIPNLMSEEIVRTALDKGRTFLKNPGLLWVAGDLTQKHKARQAIFQGKPVYSRENGFRTASTPWIFNENSTQTGGKSNLARDSLQFPS
jgi:site-specific DNA recombinase